MKVYNFLASPRYWGVGVASKPESFKCFLVLYLLKYLMAYLVEQHAW